MLIPSYAAITEEFDIPENLIAIPDALFVLSSAFFALIWGYYTDRIDRGKVIMAGAFSWTLGMLLTAFSTNYEMLLFSRILSGAGLGCVLPVGYSIISDSIPPDERSGWFGTLAILSSISNGVGQGLSAFLGPLLTWRFPFFLLAGISTIIVIIFFFVKIPQRGASEDELLDLAELNLEYSYRISTQDLMEIGRKRTNQFLIIQGFFAIIPGTILVYFMTTMLTLHFFHEIPTEIRLQTATIFAGMVGIGYILGNIILSYLGDLLYRKNRKNRARLATFCMIASIPLGIMMLLLIQPVEVAKLGIDYPESIPGDQVWTYIILTVQTVFEVYPGYIYFFFFALLASLLSAGPVANKSAVMIDVNLPEHKGTAASLFKLSEQVGKSITLLLSFLMISWLGSIYNMMLFSFFFWIPAALLWILASRHVDEDMHLKSKILSERKQESLIDFIFELEIQMDRAIQKVHDAKFYIEDNPKKFKKLITDAIRIFARCEREGESKSITDIGKKAHILKLRTVLLKKDAKNIFKELKKEPVSKKEKDALMKDLIQIKLRISEWEKSTLGKIQTYYEDAHLKIIEARLVRKTDFLSCLRKISVALNIYDRVKLLLNERIEDVKDKEDLSEEETIMLEKEKELYEKCSNALTATIKLQKGLGALLEQLREQGIKKSDLVKISELTSEYGVDLSKVMVETLAEEETKKKITEILSKTDQIFNDYDKWREDNFKVY